MRILYWLKFTFLLFIATLSTTQAIASQVTELIQSTWSTLRGVQGRPDQFWDEALKLQKWAGKAGDIALESAANLVRSSTHAVQDFKASMSDVIDNTKTIRDGVQSYMKSDMTLSNLSDALSKELGKVYDDLKNEVTDPLPSNRSERSQARAQLIERVMIKIKFAYVRAMVQVGVPMTKAESDFDNLSPKLTRVLLIAGNIIDDYPKSLEMMIFATSMFLLPEIQILRPIFGVFGFGPRGPIKGTLATWAQRKFWGGAVPAGGLFATLQKIAMTLPVEGGLWEKAVAGAGIATALSVAIRKMFFK